MSRPSPSAPNIPRLVEQLSSTDASTAAGALESVARAAARNDRDALRLAEGGAVPALVRALQSRDERAANNAAAALACVARVSADTVVEAAGSALVAALTSWGDSDVAANAAAAFMVIAQRNALSVAAEPGALQALASALLSTNDRAVGKAVAALSICAGTSPSLARLVAGTPGALAGLCAAVTSVSSDYWGPRVITLAMHALKKIADAGGIDAAVRIVSTPGALGALTRALSSGELDAAREAANVLSAACKAGPEHARAAATPAVLAALSAAAGRDGLAVNCIGALSSIAEASTQLALRVADAPGVEAALLAALTGSDARAGANAASALLPISNADVERVARLVSATPAALPALSKLLQSTDIVAIEYSTLLLMNLATHDPTLVAGLPDLPGAPLQALAAALRRGANGNLAASAALRGSADQLAVLRDDQLAVCAGVVLCILVKGSAEQAQRVLSAHGVMQAVVAAISHPNQRVVGSALEVVRAAARFDRGHAVRLTRARGALQRLLRALGSPGDLAFASAARILAIACRADADLARRVAAAPGALPVLAAQLSRGEGDAAVAAAAALFWMAFDNDGEPRSEVVRLLAAEEGLLPALAAAAVQRGGDAARNSIGVLAAFAFVREERLVRLLSAAEGVIPALVSAVRSSADVEAALNAADALVHIATTSPQDLGRRVLDAGAAEAAVEAMGRSSDQAVTGLLQALLAVDAAKVAAVLATALRAPFTAATVTACAVLASAPLSLGTVAIEALMHATEDAAQLRARAEALEALASAAAAEADATRPRACAGCGLQRESAGAGRLRPCACCSSKGPAGRVLYCSRDCQRAHWPAHKAYCKRAAVAAAGRSAPVGAA
ncbi:hypothetical protein Rsub_01739 [Raphidocelis subcapitata]|uniref:MYND-type domain-containing protein n=1 Tax=Raphidocelis subcapitata TaxID=307507 RepID=A0A2V0NMS7_9CHLO|nr:hypothetical protein Rsub_01739 [Raphidocelis subcapitata]|eukprot:GBF88838.1 hypothetical protein Rsub_01739 [Raphidocelis subcapitata]